MSLGDARTPSVVDASVGTTSPVVTVATAPIRVETFTADDVVDPETLAAQLTRMNQAIVAATAAARADPLGGATVYKGLTTGITGAKLIIKHGLGRRGFWWVVGWQGAAVGAGHSLVSDEGDTVPITDKNTLCLRSYVAGVVDVAVA